MNIKNPFVIDVDSNSLENFAAEKEGEYPFEFSKIKLWTESFFEQDDSQPPLDKVLQELSEIHKATDEIRELLNRVFKA
ncbi:MAG: hypothetical protein RSE24_02495 [Oscillospiraceae bacterium]